GLGVRVGRPDHARPLPRPPGQLSADGAAAARALRRRWADTADRRRARPAPPRPRYLDRLRLPAVHVDQRAVEVAAARADDEGDEPCDVRRRAEGADSEVARELG